MPEAIDTQNITGGSAYGLVSVWVNKEDVAELHLPLCGTETFKATTHLPLPLHNTLQEVHYI